MERRYSQTERESLALVWACEHFQMYLLGTEFTLVTDHKPLDFIFNRPNSKPVPRVERWALRLQTFKFNVRYQPGSQNIADPLSRLCVDKTMQRIPNVAEGYIRHVAHESVPNAMSWQDIVDESNSCAEIQSVCNAISSGDFKMCNVGYQSVKTELSEVQGVVLRGNRIVMPVKLRTRALELAPEGHQGIVKTKQRLRSKVWWPGIDRDAERICRSCMHCLQVSTPNPPPPLSMTKFPSEAWTFLSADLLGPLPNGQHIIVLIDYYSRFFETAIIRTTTAGKVIEFMDTVFARMGYPKALRTDNGPQFACSDFQEYLRSNDIRWVSTSPLWPQANGEVERVNRTLVKVLKIAHSNKLDLGVELRKFLVAYRSTPHASTGVAPYTLLFSREMRTKLPGLEVEVDKTLHEKAQENDALSKLKAKEYADRMRGAKEPTIEVGDSVLLKQDKRGKLDGTFSPEPHRVTAKLGSDIICQDNQGKVTRRNVTFAKAVPDRSIPVSADAQSSGVSSGDVPEEDPLAQRPQRVRNLPTRYRKYVVHALGHPGSVEMN